MRIGIDLGRTLHSVNGSKDRNPAENSFSTIKRMIEEYEADVFIISRVNSQQKEEAENWFVKHSFFEQTKIKPENVFFCFERRDKAIFGSGLRLDVMIDDRMDVLRHFPSFVDKYWIGPSKTELELDLHKEVQNYKIVYNWHEIEKSLFE